jgi:hypothetical protein
LVIGTAPESLKLSQEPNVFIFSQLAAGEYKIYANPVWQTSGANNAKKGESSEAKVLRTITLKDGEALDAGELKIEMPPVDPAAKQDDEPQHFGRQEEQDDLEAGFKP